MCIPKNWFSAVLARANPAVDDSERNENRALDQLNWSVIVAVILILIGGTSFWTAAGLMIVRVAHLWK